MNSGKRFRFVQIALSCSIKASNFKFKAIRPGKTCWRNQKDLLPACSSFCHKAGLFQPSFTHLWLIRFNLETILAYDPGLETEPDLKFSDPSGKSACGNSESRQLNAGRICIRIEWNEIQVVKDIKEIEPHINGR